MKREIKFRAWDNVLKQHLPNIQNHIGNDDWAFGNILKNTERYTVEQYTGLKDSNGVEIYDGDIVKWLFEYGDYVPEYKTSVVKIKPLESLSFCKNCEVIGNIHQNKDQ